MTSKEDEGPSGSPEAVGENHVGDGFERERVRLFGIAYRILGSRADAEDVVQDTYLRWQAADRKEIATPGAWLTTVCTRRALDMLRAAYRTRVDYVGQWLPEPIETSVGAQAEAQMELSASLSTAFLLMLERLSPKERAAYLLHDIFEMSYADLAACIDVSEPACRKLVSRARTRIGMSERRFALPVEQQEQLLDAFETALKSGHPGALASLLASDARLTADGGGKVPTVVAGRGGGVSVTESLAGQLAEWWADYDWQRTEINGALGLILRSGTGVGAVVTFGTDRTGAITDIFIMRNPDKLAGMKSDEAANRNGMSQVTSHDRHGFGDTSTTDEDTPETKGE